MKPAKAFLCGCLAALSCLVSSGCQAVDSPREKFVSIFDGRTLDGWEIRSGTAKYHVEDGAIVGTTAAGSPNTFLCTKRPYGDFILECEVMVDPRLNSGIQIRSQPYEPGKTDWTFLGGAKPLNRTHPAGRVFGYQVEIANANSGKAGGIYDEGRRGWLFNVVDDPAASKAFKDNTWNHYRIQCIGDSIKTWINGVACADLVDPVDQSGIIGLQVHSFKGEAPAQVRWRNLRVADLGRHAWQPLWDGKSLNGWTYVGGGSHEIKDGVLRITNQASVKDHGLLLSDRVFKDFTVRLKFKALKGNSGLYFRCEKRLDHPVKVAGFQAEIDAQKDVGGLYETLGRAWVIQPQPDQVKTWFRPGDWNELTVSAHGGRVVVHVNGVKTAELKDDPGRAEGHLGLQVHGSQDVDVMFKDIEILRSVK